MKWLLNKIKKMRAHDWWALFLLIICFIPAKIWKLFSKKIWVVSEYKTLARDNGYWFYKYIRENHPEIKAYYPIDFNSKDYNKVHPFGNVVRFGSLKHYCLFWAASVYCSSSSVQGFPYPRICEDLVLKNLHGFKYIFLNHGITRGYSHIINAETTNYDLLITCAALDKKIMVEDNGQPENKVALTGFARHDNLGNELYDPKLVLIMPTWREYLCYRNETSKNRIDEITREFLSSDYFSSYNGLLNSDEFINYLDQNDMHCVFYLHQNAQVYSEYFKSASARITIGLTDNYDIQTLLKQAAVLITDYSSVCYDFAYMHKPVIYYQFDRKTFEEKQYAPGDNFSYEANGFGNVCDDINDLMAELRSLENADNAMADKFIKRVDGYFSFFDHENCSRIHSAIAAML